NTPHLQPLRPVSARRKLALGLALFALFVAAWRGATFGGFVSKTFLADPITRINGGYALFSQHGFARDGCIPMWPGVGGFALGADARGVVRRVMLPNSSPAIAESLRLVLGWAWTYVIVAELIGASSGIGHMITDSQALLNTGQIIFGIIVIGVIGLISDFLFK